MSVLNIKDEETYALAAELARLSGQTMTQAVKEAIRDRLAQTRLQQHDQERLVARIKEMAHEIASSPTLDPRSPDEIIGYNEIGVPS